MKFKAISSYLFLAIFAVCLALVVYIVVVGGIVCVRDPHYDFAEYLGDLGGVYKLLIGAVLSAIGHAYVNAHPSE